MLDRQPVGAHPFGADVEYGRRQRCRAAELVATVRSLCESRLEELADHGVCELSLVLAPTGREDQHLALERRIGGQAEERALADSCLRLDHDELAMAVDGRREGSLDRGDLLPALE